MKVLKGLSASRYYGFRAANGVILITTKKGAAGKTTVTLERILGYEQNIE